MNSPLIIDPEFESKIPRQNNQNTINLIVQNTDFVFEGKKLPPHCRKTHLYSGGDFLMCRR